MRCETCNEIAKWGDTDKPTILLKKGLAITSYNGYEIKFKKKIIKCEECGDQWHINYEDETNQSLFSIMHSIFAIEYQNSPANWGGNEYMAQVRKEIVANTPIAIEE